MLRTHAYTAMRSQNMLIKCMENNRSHFQKEIRKQPLPYRLAFGVLATRRRWKAWNQSLGCFPYLRRFSTGSPSQGQAIHFLVSSEAHRTGKRGHTHRDRHIRTHTHTRTSARRENIGGRFFTYSWSFFTYSWASLLKVRWGDDEMHFPTVSKEVSKKNSNCK